MNELLTIGKIRTAHGVKGYLKVQSYSGEYSHFYDLKEISLKKNNRTKVYRVETVKPFGKEVLLKLEGIDTPEEGRKLANAEIIVAREFGSSLEEDEYYLADLIGSEIRTTDAVIGKVRAVCEGGGSDLLEVRRDSGEMLYIPFRREFIGKVDTEKGTIELIAKWLLE